jgi:hypothetical protein
MKNEEMKMNFFSSLFPDGPHATQGLRARRTSSVRFGWWQRPCDLPLSFLVGKKKIRAPNAA